MNTLDKRYNKGADDVVCIGLSIRLLCPAYVIQLQTETGKMGVHKDVLGGYIPCEAVHLYPSVITIAETCDCRGDGDLDGDKEAKGKREKVSHFLFHQITNDRDHLRSELWTGMTSSWCLPRQPKEKKTKQKTKDKRNKTFNIPTAFQNKEYHSALHGTRLFQTKLNLIDQVTAYSKTINSIIICKCVALEWQFIRCTSFRHK